MDPAMKGDNLQETSQNFASELRSFFALCILNLVFGALILAFGVQYIVTSVLALVQGGTSFGFVITQILAWGAIAFLGLRWIVSSAEVMSGVTDIQEEFRALEEPVSGEILTGLIVRMMARYREHRKAIRLMTLVCTLGGALFLALGVWNLVQAGLTLGSGGSPYLSLLAAGINLTIGMVSLLLSSWFRRYSRAWDLRLAEASRSEEALRHAMEQG
ncbi:MAG: hypothetical protein LUO87_00470 [Methanomicrobiales archaeon]|nr:hypothetical protein [Methanomicrobiales archaeon]